MNDDSVPEEEDIISSVGETTRIDRKYGFCVAAVVLSTVIAQTIWTDRDPTTFEYQRAVEVRWNPWVLFAIGSIALLAAPMMQRRWNGLGSETQAQECCRIGVLGYAIFWYVSGLSALSTTSGFINTVGLLAAYWAFRWSPGPERPLLRFK
jgi:hypothetical protein